MMYWNNGGEVRCAAHAPVKDRARWLKENWREISPVTVRGSRLVCVECGAGDSTAAGRHKAARSLYQSFHRDIARARGRSRQGDAPLFDEERT